MSTFDNNVNGENVTTAVVIRRGPSRGMQENRLSLFRGLWYMLRMAARRPVMPPMPPMPSFEPLPDGFDSASGSGADRVIYSRSLREVRFNDRSFRVPDDGSTIVILVDERQPECPIITETIRVPPFNWPRLDPTLGKKERGVAMADAFRARDRVLSGALHAVPAIHAFLS